ncbi:MAG: endonuclease [Dysgonamonadaceae bacterium]|jgi:predicted extracellular nuclease|nr:endonuclease [Dysgonamonadaceae bacterium]
MKLKPLIYFVLLCLAIPLQGQTSFRVMFYNLENLFDTENDSLKNDDEFTPEGVRHWNNHRYYTKLSHLAKVITALGEWETPALIGLCEVENNRTIEDLIAHSPLRKMQYRYVMTESEDARGIDVALLYQRDQFKYLEHESIRIDFPYNRDKKTRDILHITGKVISGDTLDVFVCHFPSRRGGKVQSARDRIQAAATLKSRVDSLMNFRSKANVLIMGDFNDEPNDKSMAQILDAQSPTKTTDPRQLYNLILEISKINETGSYKFQDQWNFIDQILVSGNLLNRKNAFHVLPETATIFWKDFMVTLDKKYGGIRPKKTFHGYKYEQGYSDHFPVYVDFIELKVEN